MISLLETIFSFIGIVIMLIYIIHLDSKINKLEEENRELRHKI